MLRTFLPTPGKELRRLRRSQLRLYGACVMSITRRVFVRNGALWLQMNNRRHERLEPTLRDTYIASVRRPDDNRIITFVRDEEKRVTALTIDLWRVKGLRFEKQKDRKE